MTNIKKISLDYGLPSCNEPHIIGYSEQPLQVGETVKFNPGDIGSWYNTEGQSEEAVVTAQVVRVLSQENEKNVLGEGGTYEEMMKNARKVAICRVELSRVPKQGKPFEVAEGGPSDWLPGLIQEDYQPPTERAG